MLLPFIFQSQIIDSFGTQISSFSFFLCGFVLGLSFHLDPRAVPRTSDDLGRDETSPFGFCVDGLGFDDVVTAAEDIYKSHRNRDNLKESVSNLLRYIITKS